MLTFLKKWHDILSSEASLKVCQTTFILVAHAELLPLETDAAYGQLQPQRQLALFAQYVWQGILLSKYSDGVTYASLSLFFFIFFGMQIALHMILSQIIAKMVKEGVNARKRPFKNKEQREGSEKMNKIESRKRQSVV